MLLRIPGGGLEESRMADRVRVLVVGLGNMGKAHASAYHRNPSFEIVGITSRSIKSKVVPDELAGYSLFDDFDAALTGAKPDAVSINSWPDTHAEYATKAMNAGAHVFMEKPIATNSEDAQSVVDLAREKHRKLMLGYILRVHPTWLKFVELGRTVGKPLVMRFSLNQQSSGPAWGWHKDLIDSLMPIVDSGVHYVDVMCQLTGARPVRVHGIGAALWADVGRPSYGHLHVEFDEGSIGWYEAGWGPMMSKVADYVREVVGPQGAVSIVPWPTGDGQAPDIIQHHHADVAAGDKSFVHDDAAYTLADQPDQQELCDREQAFFLKAIREDIDLNDSMEAAVSSLRVVLAAERSIKEQRVVEVA
jgi:predicted dehydrogenase